MSTDPRPSTPTDPHAALLTVLRGDSATPGAPAEVPAPPVGAATDTLSAASTSRHGRALAAALSGAPVLAQDATGLLTAELLAAAAARGRRVVLVAGSTTPLVRGELARLGLADVLADVPPGAAVPPRAPDEEAAADPQRWTEVRDRLQGIATARHTAPAEGVPAPFAVLAELLSLRAAQVDPPLHPAAAGWDAARRAEVAELLSAGSGPGPEEFAGRSEEDLAAALADLDALPAALTRLTGLGDRLVADLGGPAPRTVGDLGRAAELLQQVDALRSTYVPLALSADLDQAQAVLDRRPRSLLSAEERDRRREVKRLGALRHDGRFDQQDVGALRAVQRAWAEEFTGVPTTWAARPELAQALVTARALLLRGGRAVADLPTDPELLELSRVDALARDAATLAEAVRAQLRRSETSRAGLDGLAAQVPAGASAEDVARFVRAVRLRALAEADPAGGTAADETALVAEFGSLDERRRRAGAREVRAALDAGRAVRVQVVASPADARSDGAVDVLVVDDAHRVPAAVVAGLATTAGQVVLVAPPGDAADAGSGWDRAVLALVPHDLRWPPAPQDTGTTVLREDVAAVLRAGGSTVVVGRDVAGRTVDLLVGAGGSGPQLAVDLDGPAHAALPTVQDRVVARPEQLERAGHGHHLVSAAGWYVDRDAEVRRIREALTALTDRRTAADADRAAAAEVQVVAPAPAEPAAAAPVAPAPVIAEPVAPEPPAAEPPAAEPAAAEPAAPEPAPALTLPKGLGSVDDAQALVATFRADLGTAHPNVDHTPAGTVDAAVALAYARLGTTATDTAVLDAAMDVLGFRRRGVKVLRAFKESMQRSKKRMRGAGVRIT